MAAPIFPAFPDAPSRSEGSDDFSGAADAFAAALPPFALKMNLAITWMAETMTATSGYKDAAAASATQSALAASTAAQARDAAQAAVAAATTAGAAQVALAKVQADAAAASATQAGVYAVAAGSAAGLGTLGNPGEALIVNANRSGLTFGRTDGLVGDILISARNPGLPFIPANGGIRARSSAPTLLAVLGLLGGQVGQQFAVVSTVGTAAAIDIASAPAVGGLAGAAPRVMQLFNNGAVNFSSDGGATWASKTPVNTGATTFNSINYDEFNNAWIATRSDGVFPLVSYNDGTSWSPVAGLPSSPLKVIADTNGVWIALLTGSSTSVYRSTDRGTTWTAIVTGASQVHQVISTDNKGVWCVGAGTTLRRSVDGGLTWGVVFSGSATIAGISNDRAGVWLVGMSGTSTQMYRSGDNGQTFTAFGVAQAAIQDIAYTQGMFFIVRNVSPQLMIMSASADTIAPTIPATAVLSGLTKVTALNGYALAVTTANATVLRSAPIFAYDPATQFQLPNFPVGSGLTAWIKAGLQVFISGRSFDRLAPLVSFDATGMDSDGNGVIVVVSNNSTIRRTTNYGQSWSDITVAPTLLSGVVTNKKGFWLAWGSNRLIKSTDNGATWSEIPQATHGFTAAIGAITMGQANVILVHTQAPGITRISKNLGVSWADFGAIPSNVNSRSCTDGVGNWVIVAGVNAYRSTDNLVTVSGPIDTGATGVPTDVKMRKNGIVYLALNVQNQFKKSSNFGLSWEAWTVGYNSSQARIYLGSLSTVIVISLSAGDLPFVSNDGGSTFTTVSLIGTTSALAFYSSEDMDMGLISRNGLYYPAIRDLPI